MSESSTTAEASAGRQRRQRIRGRSAQSAHSLVPKEVRSRSGRSLRIDADTTEPSARGFPVDYAKLKALCRQAGLKMIDLYEPGMVPRQLVSEGTLKKWRRGGRGTSESLVKIADALSERLRWQVDWRELVQAGTANISLNRRLAILPFHDATGDRVGSDGAGGFRASILAQLSKLRGLRVVSVPDLEFATTRQPDGNLLDVELSGTLRTHGDLARLDVELTDIRTREVLWASSYPFSEADQLRAQTAIAAEVVNQIGRTLAA